MYRQMQTRSPELPDFFVAVVQDSPNPKDGFYWSTYFVNNTDADIEALYEAAQDAMGHDDEPPTLTNSTFRARGKVPARSAISLGDENEFGMDLTSHFTFFLTHGGRHWMTNITRRIYFRPTKVPVPYFNGSECAIHSSGKPPTAIEAIPIPMESDGWEKVTDQDGKEFWTRPS